MPSAQRLGPKLQVSHSFCYRSISPAKEDIHLGQKIAGVAHILPQCISPALKSLQHTPGHAEEKADLLLVVDIRKAYGPDGLWTSL